MDDNELKILIEAALDLAKSIQNIRADLSRAQEQLRNYKIKILAGLDRPASRAEIKSDLKQIEKSKNKVKITAEIDKASTRKNINAALETVKAKPIKVPAAIDTDALTPKMPKISAKADVDINGAEQVDDLRQKLDKAGNSAENVASKLYLVRSALQLLRRTATEAIDTVRELDTAAMNLAVVTGGKTSEMYAMLDKYNAKAKELGATTSQIADAATTWLRQGKTAEEAGNLIAQSMILSKTAMIDSEEAAKRITSALNGYRLSASAASAVVDKLAALDSRAAVTASDLAVAMSQTASSASIGGVSMDRLLGYLTAVQEVTQRSAETIRQSFKTIFARIGNIKLGNFLSDDGEDLSDVEMTLKNYGVVLRNTEGDFRNFGDVLDDVYSKWQQFGAIDKRAVAQAFAGTRQQENFLVLMENYGKALDYAGVAADSAGVALEKFGAYQDSLEAKTARFTAALEGLTLDTVDAGFVGDLVDAGTAIITLVEQTDLLKAALVGLGAGAVLKGVSAISSGFVEAKQNIVNLGAAMQAMRSIQDASTLSGETIARLGTLTKGLSDQQLKLVLSTQQLSKAQMTQILAAGGLSEAEAAAKLQAIGLASAEGSATAATVTFNGAMTGLGTALRAAFAANPVGLTMLAVGAAYELVQGIMAVHDAITVTAAEATEIMEESVAAFEEATNELESLNKELETTQDRIDELEAKDSLTFVEESELNKLRESVKLLQIEADLAEKKRVREAKESVDDTVIAYKKNFKYDISEVAVNKYIEDSNSSDNILNLSSNEDNVSAMLAYVEQMRRLRDETKSGSEEYIEYQDAIDEVTNSIWEQAGVLGTYKRNLEAIPYDELADDKKAVLDEINSAIELIYRTLDPSKWKDIQLTSIINDKTYSDDVERLKKLASESGVTADIIKNQFSSFASACEDAGLEIEDVAENFNTLSSSSESAADAGEKVAATFSETLDSLNAASGNISAISKALGEFKEEGNASIGTLSGMSDELKNLSSFEDFANVLSDSASTVKDVQDACNRLAKEYIDTTGILDDVNESNAKLIETQLEEMGVLNAHEIVQARLNAVKYEGVIAEASFSDATEHGTEALLKKAGASETVIESLKKLRQEEYNASIAAQDLISASTSSITALISQAKAAGVAAESIAGLGKALKLKEDYAKGKLSGMTLSEYRELMDSYSRQAKADISGISVTVPTVEVTTPKSGSSKSGSSSSKEVEAYIADIDKYREATERLRKVQEEKERIDRRINDSDDLRQRILLERQLINSYQNESSAVQTLNKLRSETIASNIESLRKLEFEVQYNSDTNELWISNMEHLNSLTAESKGKYGSMQEATNALRKETEELIKATTSLNDENRDGANSIYELGVSVRDAKSKIVEDLKDIVTQASDAVDEIQNVYDTMKTAAEEYESYGGYISIDTFQSILNLGPQYMQYLMDENDLLLINEERINKVIEAKTRQLAAEQALTYVERLKAALQDDSIENLNTLLYATTDATSATFGLAYAELELMHQMGELDDVQYSAAMHNIDAIRSLCETAVGSIGKVSGAAEKAVEESKKQLESLRDELEDMQDAGDDIIKYVMDMLKHRIQQQIDLLEEMKDKYSEIIELKKESLRASKEEEDYQKSIKSKLREMAKLQEKIDALGLDDSRSAQAERAKLLEDMAELQDELNDTQSEKAISATEDALDKMEEAYHQEKDNEIKILEDSISSYQKLWSKAIEYIRSNYSTLLSEILDWNYSAGNSLSSSILETWGKCQSAAQRYGDFVSAMMGGIKNEIASINAEIERMGSASSSMSSSGGSIGSANVVGKVDKNHTVSNEDRAAAIIKRMYSNMNEHGGSGSSTSAARKAELSQENLRLGAQLSQYGISAYRSTDKEDLGTWYTDSTKREKLFDKYKLYIYHNSGIAGDNGTMKDDEILAKLQKGEPVLTQKMWDNLKSMMERMDRMDRMSKMMSAFASKPPAPIYPALPDLTKFRSSTIHNITNNSNQPVEINLGPVTVNAPSGDGKIIADEVRKITYENVDQIAQKLKLKL